MTQKINRLYFMIFLAASIGSSLQIIAYDHSCNSCANKKLSDTTEQNRNLLARDIKNDIYALRFNIEDYGASHATYNALDAIETRINNLCMECPEAQTSACKTKQHNLQWKLDNARRLAERQSKKMAKNGKIARHRGGGGIFLAPVFTVSSPAIIIAANE